MGPSEQYVPNFCALYRSHTVFNVIEALSSIEVPPTGQELINMAILASIGWRHAYFCLCHIQVKLMMFYNFIKISTGNSVLKYDVLNLPPLQ